MQNDLSFPTVPGQHLGCQSQKRSRVKRAEQKTTSLQFAAGPQEVIAVWSERWESERGWSEREREDLLVVESAEREERPGTTPSLRSGLALHSLPPAATCLHSLSTPAGSCHDPLKTQPCALSFAPQQTFCVDLY